MFSGKEVIGIVTKLDLEKDPTVAKEFLETAGAEKILLRLEEKDDLNLLKSKITNNTQEKIHFEFIKMDFLFFKLSNTKL